ncbi:Hypothetical protein FORC18_4001 [Vibrio parahaemolyticus]|nr:hypothetical protein FORC8_3995 [Vibrio parahaemolyticus]APE86614.1 Hypothetical protein FORC18_4001 [Vibrio parahaemolyticus]
MNKFIIVEGLDVNRITEDVISDILIGLRRTIQSELKLRVVTIQLSGVVELGFSICNKHSFHLKNTSAIFQSYAQLWSSLCHHKARGRSYDFI